MSARPDAGCPADDDIAAEDRAERAAATRGSRRLLDAYRRYFARHGQGGGR